MIDGTYKIHAKTPMGDIDALLTYKTDGNRLMGSVDAFGAQTDIINGTCRGDSFEHTIKADTDKGSFNIKVKGSVNGDEISGTLKMMLLSARFGGKRIK